jgi:hypothetical protein
LAVAERLGYCFVDHQRFLEDARGYGLDADRLWHLEEERPSLFERFDGETRRYIAVIQAVLFEIAAEDRPVVIGRGGQWLMRDVPHVLRARVVAPFEFRVTELMETFSAHGGERLSAHAAAQMVQRDDAQKLKRSSRSLPRASPGGRSWPITPWLRRWRSPWLAAGRRDDITLRFMPSTGSSHSSAHRWRSGQRRPQRATCPACESSRPRAVEIPPMPPFVA